MSKVRALVLLTLVLGVASGITMADAPFLVNSVTSTQTALFIPFVASMAGDNPISTALSVSNILAAPDAIEEQILDIEHMNDTEGTITFYFWAADGTMLSWETQNNDVGNGVLTDDGKLGPGRTLTVSVEDILIQLGEMPEAGNVFTGYGWVVSNFDASQGTVNVYFPGLGFAQSLNMEPTLGNLAFPFGIPLPFGPMLIAAK